jgi:hypothetical protein
VQRVAARIVGAVSHCEDSGCIESLQGYQVQRVSVRISGFSESLGE